MFSGEDFSLGGPPLQVKANIGSNASLRCEATIKFADCTFRATSGEVRTIPTDCGRRDRKVDNQTLYLFYKSNLSLQIADI